MTLQPHMVSLVVRMIFGIKQARPTTHLVATFIALLLTACGGGGTDGNSPVDAGNSSLVPPPSSATYPSSISSISSSAPSSRAASSLTASNNSRGGGQVSSSSITSTQSSYARSSRASSTPTDFDNDVVYPEEPGEYIDLPPSAPRQLKLEAISAVAALISWAPAKDDVGLSRYEIRRDGVVVGTVSTDLSEYEDPNLTPNTFYSYTVRAVDIIGNRSNFSENLIAKTAAASSSSKSSTVASQSSTSTISSIYSISSASESSSSTASFNQTSSTITAASSQSSQSSIGENESSSQTSNSSSATSIHQSSSSITASSSQESESSASGNASTSSEQTSSNQSSSTEAQENGTVRLEWSTPTSREDGTYLELEEIGGYELKYKQANSSIYVIELITDRHLTSIELSDAAENSLFQIAAFDTNGLYSRFVQLTPK